MLLSADLINTNGISQIALAFFTALFGMIGWLIKLRYDERKELRDARKAVEEARKEAKTAAENAAEASSNTRNVSNGFARNVLGKLERIDEKVDALSDAIRDHLEWHLEKEKK